MSKWKKTMGIRSAKWGACNVVRLMFFCAENEYHASFVLFHPRDMCTVNKNQTSISDTRHQISVLIEQTQKHTDAHTHIQRSHHCTDTRSPNTQRKHTHLAQTPQSLAQKTHMHRAHGAHATHTPHTPRYTTMTNWKWPSSKLFPSLSTWNVCAYWAYLGTTASFHTWLFFKQINLSWERVWWKKKLLWCGFLSDGMSEMARKTLVIH